MVENQIQENMEKKEDVEEQQIQEKPPDGQNEESLPDWTTSPAKKQEQVMNMQPQKSIEIQQQRERNLNENIDDIAIIRETMAEDDMEMTGAIDLEKHDLVNLQSEVTTPKDESTMSKIADKRLSDAIKPSIDHSAAVAEQKPADEQSQNDVSQKSRQIEEA